MLRARDAMCLEPRSSLGWYWLVLVVMVWWHTGPNDARLGQFRRRCCGDVVLEVIVAIVEYKRPTVSRL
jgi:hypothetical protein